MSDYRYAHRNSIDGPFQLAILLFSESNCYMDRGSRKLLCNTYRVECCLLVMKFTKYLLLLKRPCKKKQRKKERKKESKVSGNMQLAASCSLCYVEECNFKE